MTIIRMFRTLFVVLVLFSYDCFSIALPSFEEKLTYEVKFSGISVGSGLISISKFCSKKYADSIKKASKKEKKDISCSTAKKGLARLKYDNKEAFRLLYQVEASIFFGFYKVKDTIEAIMSEPNLDLLYLKKNIAQGKHKKKQEVKFLPCPKSKEYCAKTSKGKIYTLKTAKKASTHVSVHDPMSIIYLLRSQNLKKGEKYEFLIYTGKKVKNMVVEVLKEEKIKSDLGTINCFVASFSLINGKKKGNMKVWFTKDKQKLPLRIEQTSKIGTITLELKKKS